MNNQTTASEAPLQWHRSTMKGKDDKNSCSVRNVHAALKPIMPAAFLQILCPSSVRDHATPPAACRGQQQHTVKVTINLNSVALRHPGWLTEIACTCQARYLKPVNVAVLCHTFVEGWLVWYVCALLEGNLTRATVQKSEREENRKGYM